MIIMQLIKKQILNIVFCTKDTKKLNNFIFDSPTDLNNGFILGNGIDW